MRRAVLVVVAVALVAAGCRGDDDRRNAVESYIESVNRVQAKLRPAFRDAQDAIRTFASGRVTERTAERLRGGSATMRATRASLALIEPPPEARRLHADLLRLVDLQSGLALELSLAADYVTRLGPATRPAQEAAASLGRSLRSAKTGKEQVTALHEFAAAVGGSLARVDALAPPPAMLPWHENQRARLAKSRRDALALASGIEKQDAPAVEEALKAFTSRPSETVSRKAQTAAIRTFNDRLREQERLLAKIAREQLALANV
ncbi:MAG TPA: hypothetical protein VGQ15_15945 [Gaiellaceae bacterium]|nr:hypothetical protein [Gaiellaceae bacterium]